MKEVAGGAASVGALPRKKSRRVLLNQRQAKKLVSSDLGEAALLRWIGKRRRPESHDVANENGSRYGTFATESLSVAMRLGAFAIPACLRHACFAKYSLPSAHLQNRASPAVSIQVKGSQS